MAYPYKKQLVGQRVAKAATPLASRRWAASAEPVGQLALQFVLDEWPCLNCRGKGCWACDEQIRVRERRDGDSA